ncbi:peroxidase, putative (macronuclear) [Tetrahymena thermophila SB210]|uniref:Peroxidase, putative n=1 Tax=Tetrahymena thermophila (strain SB210) TaxID=312017 RepID=Q22P04_TETTS|nr:peroxidase, putative [Tetrahymena thermophila SB210]EAR87007.1 peroxidase, putative [Tetrahymena thermophila SB210]|eukprot:XP_001007252.1 peroxidase, putative [Tetrahymena thermophila SB210]
MKTIIILLLIATSAVIADDFSSSEYQAQQRNQKLNKLWQAITENKQSGTYPSPLEIASIFTESMSVTIDYKSDSLPEGRKKLIHSVGVVGQVKFVAEPDTPYTGLFKGADSALVRFSLAKPPNYSKPEAKYAFDNYTPGLGLKFLADGVPSANLVAMWGVNGVDSFNFFDKDMNTHIPNAEGLQLKLVAKKFSTATPIVQNVGLRSFADRNQDGSQVSEPKFPFKLTFRAPSDIKNRFTDNFTREYSQIFAEIQPGTTVLEVLAMDDPATGCLKKIGSLITTSEFTTSKFGDKNLFFQHQAYTNDIELHSQWSDYTPYFSFFGSNLPKKPEGKCPFASLLGL